MPNNLTLSLDFDGTITADTRRFALLTSLLYPHSRIIILTGRPISEKDSFERILKSSKIKYHKVYMYPKSNPEYNQKTFIDIARWKSEIVNKENVDIACDDDNMVINKLRQETNALVLKPYSLLTSEFGKRAVRYVKSIEAFHLYVRGMQDNGSLIDNFCNEIKENIFHYNIDVNPDDSALIFLNKYNLLK
jgi:hypothetical protein